MKLDLSELAKRAKAGDKDAFGDLYDQTFELIYKFFVFRVKDPDDAKDLTSQVYLEAWQNLFRFDTNRNFAAWIFGFAKYRLIDHYRKQRSQVSLDAVTERASRTDLEAQTAQKLEAEQLQDSLHHLVEPYRTILELRYLQELEYSEISKLLGKTESHLRVLVKRGLERLRKHLILHHEQ